VLRRPGPILLISCYDLGHQPLAVASAAVFLERAGYTPDTLDISVESFEVESAVRARFVGISVPMHTALRLGVRVAEQIRQTNPTCHICFYGLYASLNAEYLLERVADSVWSKWQFLPLRRYIKPHPKLFMLLNDRIALIATEC